MAGGFSSKWRTMGSNTNSTVDSGTSGGGTSGIGTLDDGVSNISNEGTNKENDRRGIISLSSNVLLSSISSLYMG